MRTGSPELWALAEGCDVIPSPPDGALAAMLSGWWSLPRTFGCPGAREAEEWVVVAPSPLILCPTCALVAFESIRACCYCKKPVRVAKSVALFFEMNNDIRVVGRAHRHCSERARSTR